MLKEREDRLMQCLLPSFQLLRILSLSGLRLLLLMNQFGLLEQVRQPLLNKHRKLIISLEAGSNPTLVKQLLGLQESSMEALSRILTLIH